MDFRRRRARSVSLNFALALQDQFALAFGVSCLDVTQMGAGSAFPDGRREDPVEDHRSRASGPGSGVEGRMTSAGIPHSFSAFATNDFGTRVRGTSSSNHSRTSFSSPM